MGKKVIILDADFGLANIEVMFGGEALHYCVEKYDINDARVVLSNNASHKKPNSG